MQLFSEEADLKGPCLYMDLDVVILDNINGLATFGDDIEWSFSYKWFSRQDPRFDKSKWTFEKKEKAKVAVFHGRPLPHDSDQEWVKKEWN